MESAESECGMWDWRSSVAARGNYINASQFFTGFHVFLSHAFGVRSSFRDLSKYVVGML